MPLKNTSKTKATAADENANAGDNQNVELVGPNKDLDPASPEGAQWIADENTRLAAEAQTRKDDEEIERKRLAQEELDIENKRKEQEAADLKTRQADEKKKREDQAALDEQALKDAEAAKDKDLGKGAPKPGRYAAVKSRLRDPISGKSFLVGQSTIVKKADITKWFVKQLDAKLLTPFDEAEEEEE